MVWTANWIFQRKCPAPIVSPLPLWWNSFVVQQDWSWPIGKSRLFNCKTRHHFVYVIPCSRHPSWPMYEASWSSSRWHVSQTTKHMPSNCFGKCRVSGNILVAHFRPVITINASDYCALPIFIIYNDLIKKWLISVPTISLHLKSCRGACEYFSNQL